MSVASNAWTEARSLVEILEHVGDDVATTTQTMHVVCSGAVHFDSGQPWHQAIKFYASDIRLSRSCNSRCVRICCRRRSPYDTMCDISSDCEAPTGLRSHNSLQQIARLRRSVTSTRSRRRCRCAFRDGVHMASRWCTSPPSKGCYHDAAGKC
jgi:hypothetical protein